MYRHQRLLLFGHHAFWARLRVDYAQCPQLLATVDESCTRIEAAASGDKRAVLQSELGRAAVAERALGGWLSKPRVSLELQSRSWRESCSRVGTECAPNKRLAGDERVSRKASVGTSVADDKDVGSAR